MKNKKILLGVLLTIVLLLILGNTHAYGKSLQELQAEFPTGSKWTGGGECHGFATYMYREYYGVRPTTYKVTGANLDQIQPGDLVRYVGNMGHSVWIIGRNGNTVTLGEANYDLNNGVRWTTRDISAFSNLSYVCKAPYVLGTTPPVISAPSNIKTTVEDGKGVRVSWNIVDKATEYVVKVYRASDVRNGNFNNPVVSATRTNAINYNYDFLYVDIKEEGDFCAFVHTKIGYNMSPNGGTPSNFSIKLINKIELTPERNELVQGEATDIITKFYPADANMTKITYSSSDRNIATVDENGNVTTKATGTVTIYATSNNGIKASTTIKVKEGVMITGIYLNTYNKTIRVGQQFKLSVTKYIPENATYKEVTWESNNEEVAIINQDGTVTAIGEGKAYIRAKSAMASITCIVNVEPAIPVTEITINKTEAELVLGETEKLTAKVTPTNATIKTVTWSSSNPSIATIDANGLITPKTYGTTTITATSGSCSATCKVKVYTARFEEKFLNLEKSIAGFMDLEKYEAELTDGNIGKVAIKSNNTCVTTTGRKIFGVQAGFATITGYEEEYGNLTYICFVNDSIRMSDGSYKFPGDLNGNRRFDTEDVSLLRTIIESQNLSEDNKKICDINGDGKYNNEDVDLLNRIVKEELLTINDIKINDISINKETSIVGNKKRYSVFATVSPDNATIDKTITYSSSNTKVATVNQYGNITVLKPGTVTITATTSNGLKDSASFTFTEEDAPTVENIKVTSINLKQTNYTFKELGVKETMVAQILPANATNKKLTWTSSNTKVATVDQYGNVLSISNGKAIITATAQDGSGVKATCEVTVNFQTTPTTIEISKIELNKTTISIEKGKTENLTATINPNNTTQSKSITWTSDKTGVATVDSTGKVTAVSVGTAIITAKTSNGKTATCTVTVTNPKEETKPDNPDKPTTIKLGDVNKDGKIDVFDARVILRKAASRQEFTEYEKQAGDVNKDKAVNVLDARRILMYSAKIISKF